MDLNNNNIVGETKEDRISELPDSLLHYILSFIDTKCVARTAILSKRWNCIWTSIPTLEFPYWYFHNLPSLSEINKFMDFVDTTLLRHDPSSSIQKFSLYTKKNMNASQIRSWIENLVRCNVEELRFRVYLANPFVIPLSVFTCVSLIKLVLSAPFNMTIHLPESFSCPKLKSLTLCGIQFNDDCSWNEQHFSNCPVLENLILKNCTWIGVSNFCISTPTLKLLEIDDNSIWDEDGLPDCVLKIDAPNLVSLTYHGNVPKEYVLSSFETLESARVLLKGCAVSISEQKMGYYVAAVSKFFGALSHVQSLTIESLEVLSIVEDFGNILPTFHNLDKLSLELEETTDKSVFQLLKAAPNLTSLTFDDVIHYIHRNENEDEDSWFDQVLTAGCLFQHLQSVSFVCFREQARGMRWLKLILKNAKALQTVSIKTPYLIDAIRKEVLILNSTKLVIRVVNFLPFCFYHQMSCNF